MITSSCGDCANLSSTPDSTDEQARVCMECGECLSKCFLSLWYPDMNPRKLIRMVLAGRSEELLDSEFIWACTLCGRCTTDCRKGIAMDAVVRDLRGRATAAGKAPERLLKGVDNALKLGNNPGMDNMALVDMVEWLAEEAGEEIEGLEEGEFTIPIDREDAEFLYLPNPREYTSNPQIFQTYLKFFHYCGTDYTVSSKVFDITNWAYYLGDQEATLKLVRNVVEEARRLNVKTLLSTECGHGFKILRKDAEGWLGEPLGFEVISVVELAHRYLLEGKLPIKEGAIEARVTYHDPCNVGRKLGIYTAPRELLKAICTEYVELWPNMKHSVCCGGGGSVAQNQALGQKRLDHAKLKHEQVIRTGADILATSCQNCLSQLEDLRARYNTPVEVKSVLELVVQAIEEGR